tara:strand:+ start:1860 stop:2198 length:339 start_codon:yes stop_codon:yes gene_type:complete
MILEAIEIINPNAKAIVYGHDIDTCRIVWGAGTEEISKEDIKAKFPEAEFKIALNDLRMQRTRLLQETDWYALSDVTMADNMKTYRQALRDITNGLTTTAQVKAVTFPTKPS